MKKNPKHDHKPEKFLSKTQEVFYQREFKNADKVYNQLSQKGNRR